MYPFDYSILQIQNELSQLLRFIIIKFMFGIKDLFAVTGILAFLLFVFIIFGYKYYVNLSVVTGHMKTNYWAAKSGSFFFLFFNSIM